MNLSHITADNMQKHRLPNNDSINNILINIEAEAKQGRLTLYLPDYEVSKFEREELEKRGFKVEVGGRYNESNTMISWSK